ncbi:MAG: hypothetical protein Q9165_007441 [Trypethelium subeluteriae]
MSDPFSIAGTAAGVISLGIQVCQGLVEYYRAWENQDEEIKETLKTLTREQEILQLLRSTLTNQPAGLSTSVTKVEACITQIKTEFVKLDVVLRKCQQTHTSNDFQETIKNIKKSLLYPFKRETVWALKCSVAEVGRILAVAVSHLQLVLSSEQHQNLEALLNATSDQKSDLSSIKDTTSKIVSKMKSIDQNIVKISELNVKVEDRTMSIQSDMSRVRSELAEVGIGAEKSAKILPELKRSADIILTRVDEVSRVTQGSIQDVVQQVRILQLALVSKPSLQRDVCDELDASSGAMENGAPSARPVVVSQAPATIRLQTQVRQARQVMASRGALLDDLYTPTPNLASYLKTALRDILQLFQEGAASPRDVTTSGETYLYAACLLSYHVDAEASDAYSELVLGLISAGVPMNEINFKECV